MDRGDSHVQHRKPRSFLGSIRTSRNGVITAIARDRRVPFACAGGGVPPACPRIGRIRAIFPANQVRVAMRRGILRTLGRMLQKVAGILALATAVVIVGLWLAARSSRTPRRFGLENGRLRSAPPTPNWVSSEGASGDAAIEPLARGAQAQQAFQLVRELIDGRPDMEVVLADGDYLHAIARTGLFAFVDDLELRLDRDEGVLHVRSASRVGHSDLGANAKRVRGLRDALAQKFARGDE